MISKSRRSVDFSAVYLLLANIILRIPVNIAEGLLVV